MRSSMILPVLCLGVLGTVSLAPIGVGNEEAASGGRA
jgi:hypothetical protein